MTIVSREFLLRQFGKVRRIQFLMTVWPVVRPIVTYQDFFTVTSWRGMDFKYFTVPLDTATLIEFSRNCNKRWFFILLYLVLCLIGNNLIFTKHATRGSLLREKILLTHVVNYSWLEWFVFSFALGCTVFHWSQWEQVFNYYS